MTSQKQVLICGAGPTGLFLAYALTKLGINVDIIDTKSGVATESRALGVHARTLEFYRQFGLAEPLINLGIIANKLELYINQSKQVELSLAKMGETLSKYPFMLVLAQDIHEKFLVTELSKLNCEISWNTKLTKINDHQDHVDAELEHNHSKIHKQYSYVIGCDGASSIVRKSLNLEFAGGTTTGVFYVADVHNQGSYSETVKLAFTENNFNLMLPVRTTGMQRIIGIIPDHIDFDSISAQEQDDLLKTASNLLNSQLGEVNWFSTYKVHHRVANQFRVNNCFIAGDAGHIHSPVGGQGMNTGIGDAMNIAWKLAHVLNKKADPVLLNSYEPERIAFANLLINTTDKIFDFITSNKWLAKIFKTKIFPNFLKIVKRFQFSQTLLFKTISQIRICYPNSILSKKTKYDSKKISAGDRLPFVYDIDNHECLKILDWSIHIYGQASQEIQTFAKENNLQLFEFSFSKAAKKIGFKKNMLYLIRPDGYICCITDANGNNFYHDLIGLKGVVFGLASKLSTSNDSLS